MRLAYLVGCAAVVASACGDDGGDEMQIYVVEDAAVTNGPVATGVGLGLEVVLRVGQTLGGTQEPQDLEVVPVEGGVLVEELGGVAFSYDGSVDPGGQEGTLVRLTPGGAGTKTIRFFADNAVEDPTLTLDARTVDETEFSATVQGDATATDAASGEMNVFVGNRIFLQATERSGGQRVLGHERFEVDAPAGSGTSILELEPTFISEMLDVGDAPHDAIVRSPASGDTLVVHAVDTSAIWRVGFVIGGEPFDASSPYSLATGSLLRVQLTASDRSGAAIPGNAPAEPTFEIHGDSLVAAGRTASGGVAELQAVAVGESIVSFQWGAAQAALTVDVVAE